VRLSPPTRSRLLETLDRLANPVERAAGWIVLWEELLDRRVAIPAFLAALERGLSSEPVEQILQLQTTYLKELFWRFLPAAAREPAAPRLEGLLRRQINRAPTATLKATCFATLRSIFTTQESIAFLERVWLGSEHITGLVLSETDHGLVALELATRGIGSGVLSAQRRRFIDPDRRARFEFVMDAAADEARRAAFFDALADASNRRHEPWVVEGLTYLSHPLRATSAERYLRPALDLLEEIQRTGDIFFPAHWMAAVLGGHRSESAAAIVRDFLRERPTYPVHLRRIVLQSADNLFRAVALNSA
jgi:aminopeptidase N